MPFDLLCIYYNATFNISNKFLSAFIKSDRPKKYKNLSIKYVRGLDPIIKLYDAENKVEDVLDIHKWDTDSVDEFLSTHLSKD